MGPELFGVGFAEAVLVLVIALIVVGPQRFPDIARQGGRWYAIARRYTAEITADLRGALSELEEEVNAETRDLRAIREIGQEVEADLKETESQLDDIKSDTAQAADSGTSSAPVDPPDRASDSRSDGTEA